MRETEMQLLCIGRPEADWQNIRDWLKELEGDNWVDRVSSEHSDAELLVEAAGRRCYKSFDVGLNPNITRIRTDTASYLQDGILKVGHGSVLEHAQFVFAVEGCSRVLTHELVRHRAGTAISQESMRFVRLDDLPFWWPEWAKEDPWLYARGCDLLQQMEYFQLDMAEHFKLDDDGVPFSEKKVKTSFMRRFAPDGVATGMVWSGNVRAVRHVIEQRIDPHAEEEIQIFARLLLKVMQDECPALFADYTESENGVFSTEWRKV